MADLNLDPVVGEEVRWGDRPGVFKIVRVRQPGEEHPNTNLKTHLTGLGTVDLRREGENFIHQAVPWAVLRYVDETRPVRRVIEWLKSNPLGKSYPKYVVGYEVKLGDDHADYPSIFVRFFVDPDYIYENGRPSEEKVAELNRFLEEVQRELLSLDLGRWTYVRAAEAPRALDVAS